MSVSITKRTETLLFLLCSATVIYGSPPALAATNVLVPQRGIGAKYGSRDPYTCSSKTAPTSGPMTSAYARQYFICAYEGVGDERYLNLAENVRVQVGKGVVPRGYYANLAEDQDPNAKEYPLRVSYDSYFCSPIISKGFLANQGKNCTLKHQHTTAECYRTTFGDWRCPAAIDINARQIPDQPAPKH